MQGLMIEMDSAQIRSLIKYADIDNLYYLVSTTLRWCSIACSESYHNFSILLIQLLVRRYAYACWYTEIYLGVGSRVAANQAPAEQHVGHVSCHPYSPLTKASPWPSSTSIK